MPKITKNVNRRGLSKEERAEYEAVGYTDEQIKKFEELLKQPSWDFWSRVSELYLSLAAGSQVVVRSGKMVSDDTVTSCKFSKNYFSTSNREVARLIFMSDPYRDGTIKLVEDQVKDDAAAKYSEFKNAVLSNPENIEKLKKDLELANA